MVDGPPSSIITPPIGRAMVAQSGIDGLLSLKRGADAIVNAVRVTFGPISYYALIHNQGASPIVTRDGAFIARSIDVTNRFENMGAQIMREGILSTSDKYRDGATTTALLAQAIMENGVVQIAAGANAMHLAHGIRSASKTAIESIAQQTHADPEIKMLCQAAITCSGDPKIGTEVATMIARLGSEAGIEIQDGAIGIQSHYRLGMQLNRGWYSPRLVTDQSGEQAVLEKALVLITSSTIHGAELMNSIITRLARLGQPFVIIADDIDEAALQTLVVNKMKGSIDALAIQAPGYGENRLEILEDIAIFTGGTVVHDMYLLLQETAGDLSSHLGSAGRLVSLRRSSAIAAGGGNPASVKERVLAIKQEIEDTINEEERNILRDRLSHLDSGVGVIEYGAATELEGREVRRKLNTTVEVTRATMKGGTVPGGGTAYINACKALANTQWSENEQDGAECLRKALQRPTEQIAENAGYSGPTVVSKLNAMKSGYGFNALNGQYEDMIERGVVDSSSVTMTALRAATSIAVSLLTTDVAIHYAPSVWWPSAPKRPDLD